MPFLELMQRGMTDGEDNITVHCFPYHGMGFPAVITDRCLSPQKLIKQGISHQGTRDFLRAIFELVWTTVAQFDNCAR